MVNAKLSAPRMRRAATRLMLIGVLSVPTLAWAETLPWASLSQEQQATLADFQPRWDEISDARRSQLVERAQRWSNLPDERRQAILTRWNEIKSLSPETRDALRQRWNSMSPDERRQALGAPHTSDGTMPASISN